MTSYDEYLVATIALVGSMVALAISVGPWTEPYRLRSIAAIADRFGMTVARLTWMTIAIVSLLAGIAIASGVRPEFARPASTPGGSGQLANP